MTCWVGDETKYTCPTQTFYGFTNSPSGGRSPGFTRIRGKRGVLAGGSCVLGQLVDSGVQMHLANGKQLGVAYRAALGLDDIPKEPEVMFRSTDVARVYQSVEALAMGMFPEIVNGKLLWILRSHFQQLEFMSIFLRGCVKLEDHHP
ncbi:hypothetical protein FOZ62_012647 [Perkinsus olseni]|uniref:Uncharacterized protein n=1 Tax=Perkinsus olseni TaxID=32597 RepID=A0A7J6S0J6_PEROL|nr:hypothetical protein FOZ62_012647 [Perkinsus olseni]